MLVDLLSALARSCSFLALFQAAGVAMFIALFGRQLFASALALRRIGFWSAIAGIALVSAHYALEAARIAGELPGVLDPSLQRLVFASPMGAVWAARSLGLVLIAANIRCEGRGPAVRGVIGAITSIQTFSLVGHTANHAEHAWLVPLIGVHLTVVAFWFGALPALYVASQVEGARAAGRLVREFSHLALWLVPIIFVAGVLMTVILVDRWSVFARAYGLLLLTKIAGFAVLMALAALNKWRYGPALATTPSAAIAFRRSVALEYALICGVLVVAAIATMFYSPEH